VNLGYLTHPRTHGHGKDRGQGAELRTDAAAAVRAAKGILFTTFARIKAVGHQLDREELMQLLEEGEALFKALGQYAGQHGGTAADSAAQTQLVSAVKHWDASVGSASSNAPADDGSAIMAFGASTGSVNVTPKTHFVYAGQNIDQIAQQHLQLMSGQQFNATAGRGMHLFARGSGVQAIAAEGPMVLQAQADALTATAQKGVKISTNENEVFVSAPTIRLVAEDGSYIKIGGASRSVPTATRRFWRTHMSGTGRRRNRRKKRHLPAHRPISASHCAIPAMRRRHQRTPQISPIESRLTTAA
jgi:type VI secretion system secreted protein VgrG